MISVTFNCISKSEGPGNELSCIDGGNTDTSGGVAAEQSGDNEGSSVTCDEDDECAGFVSLCCRD